MYLKQGRLNMDNQKLPGPPPKQRMTRKFLSDKYDLLYDLAKRIVKDHNPCNMIFTEVKNQIPAVGCRAWGVRANNPLCCSGFNEGDTDYICIHWGTKGCRVKSLRCALWYCETCNFNDRMPHVHFEKDVVSVTPVLSQLHLNLIKEMKKYRFDGVFREGKVKTIESAYQSFKKGDYR